MLRLVSGAPAAGAARRADPTSLWRTNTLGARLRGCCATRGRPSAGAADPCTAPRAAARAAGACAHPCCPPGGGPACRPRHRAAPRAAGPRRPAALVRGARARPRPARRSAPASTCPAGSPSCGSSTAALRCAPAARAPSSTACATTSTATTCAASTGGPPRAGATPVVRTWQPEQHRRIVLVLDTSRTTAGRIGDAPGWTPRWMPRCCSTALAARAGDRVAVSPATGWSTRQILSTTAPAARRPSDAWPRGARARRGRLVGLAHPRWSRLGRHRAPRRAADPAGAVGDRGGPAAGAPACSPTTGSSSPPSPTRRWRDARGRADDRARCTTRPPPSGRPPCASARQPPWASSGSTSRRRPGAAAACAWPTTT